MTHIEMVNRRTGERFRSRAFASVDEAVTWGERVDESEWLWALEEEPEPPVRRTLGTVRFTGKEAALSVVLSVTAYMPGEWSTFLRLIMVKPLSVIDMDLAVWVAAHMHL